MPMVNGIIGPYQCSFRPGKSTIDQIFTLRQILEKTHEKHIDTFHLFVYYKAAFDNPIRSEVFKVMSAFGISVKLIRLCMITLSGTRSAVKVEKDLLESFNTKRGFRQGDSNLKARPPPARPNSHSTRRWYFPCCYMNLKQGYLRKHMRQLLECLREKFSERSMGRSALMVNIAVEWTMKAILGHRHC